jgi:DNA mismatch repair protein MutS
VSEGDRQQQAAHASALRLTPMRRQYLALKRRHPDAILFFRLGDFYETFDDDAQLTARVLHLTLTSREVGKGQRVPMAGVPYHAADAYIARLIAAGYKVAVCEQLDTPATVKAAGKSMMTRDVVRVVTPGTVVEPRMLDARRNNYLCALVADYGPSGTLHYGLAHADVTTGEFAIAELAGPEAATELARELERLNPAECLVPAMGAPGTAEPSLEEQALAGRNLTRLEAWRFELGTAQETLCRLFGVTSLAGFGCAERPLATRAAGALAAYVEATNRPLLALFDGLRAYDPGAFVRLDGFTRRNLELDEPPGTRAAGPPRRAMEGTARPTLLSVIDACRTSMGSRLLRRWLGQPLRDLEALRVRHDVVEALAGDGVRRARLRELLGRMADVERLTNRVRQGSAQPRDLLALRASLLAAGEIRNLAAGGEEGIARSAVPAKGALERLLAQVDPSDDVADLIGRAVYDASEAAPAGKRAALGTWEDERLIRTGYSAELDELVRSSSEARRWIAGLEAAERERTGIKSLKVGFNKVFGYYIQISHAYKGAVPPHYIRRQTLADGERYMTQELKEYENLVLRAQERIGELERELFTDLQRQVAGQASRLLATAAALAELDVLAGFAEVAAQRGYVRPELDAGLEIEIVGGRHPVVEAALEAATVQVGQPSAFVPNDCRLSAGGEQIVILTGPNMAGKSTYLRSVALIVLLAQVGSFVPAQRARIGLVDRIFTRVGAQDDLAAGQSTFMVEMVETASILRHATERSLVVLDEIGRGTSTYDGVAIAQAVVEYLHGAAGSRWAEAGPRTLFATHYHELADLAQRLPRVRNYRMDVLEEGGQVVFLHRVVPGSADRSYGIHVAKLAGVPRDVTRRAEEVLAGLEAQRTSANGMPVVEDATRSPARGGPPGRTAPPAGMPAPEDAGRLPEPPAADGAAAAAVPAHRHAANGAASAPTPTGAGKAVQLALFPELHPVLEELRRIDILTMTPLEALNRLAELVQRARET